MYAGKLEFREGARRRTIGCLFNGAVVWELPIDDVRIIGEMTSDHGPFDDDYYFCVATSADCWYEASFYAEGRDELLKVLAGTLNCQIELRLVGSTDYDSNVLWPPHLAGQPMFTFTPVPPETWIGRLFGPSQYKQWFSDAVLAELLNMDSVDERIKR